MLASDGGEAVVRIVCRRGRSFGHGVYVPAIVAPYLVVSAPDRVVSLARRDPWRGLHGVPVRAIRDALLAAEAAVADDLEDRECPPPHAAELGRWLRRRRVMRGELDEV